MRRCSATNSFLISGIAAKVETAFVTSSLRISVVISNFPHFKVGDFGSELNLSGDLSNAYKRSPASLMFSFNANQVAPRYKAPVSK